MKISKGEFENKLQQLKAISELDCPLADRKKALMRLSNELIDNLDKYDFVGLVDIETTVTEVIKKLDKDPWTCYTAWHTKEFYKAPPKESDMNAVQKNQYKVWLAGFKANN